MNLFNEIERVTQQYKINPRVYKLFLKLSEEERTNFLKDLLRLNEEQHETKI
jgi:iron uptake system EfeUOB component EfeO/EfeM